MEADKSRMLAIDRFFFGIFDHFASTSLQCGQLDIVLPNGRRRSYGSAGDVLPAVPQAPAWMEMPRKQCTLHVHNTDMFFKIITRHDSGLGEAYTDGDFTVKGDLGCFMAIMTANARNIEASRGLLGALNWAGDKVLYLAHLARPNTVAGSRKNISEHYDAGNAMYKLFLDPSLTYSSAIHHEGDSLEAAQMRKLDALIQGAGVTADSHVLEVGCGWGSAAIRAAQTTGCRWTGAHAFMSSVSPPTVPEHRCVVTLQQAQHRRQRHWQAMSWLGCGCKRCRHTA